ncbi:MAG: glycoside hydrolase family 32 protein [Anaerolineales bacterium]
MTTLEKLWQARLAAERTYQDPHRPQYHFLPLANWMNDPNGLIQWQGRYHLFYQYNPNGAFHGSIHWGHAVSEDLVHWRDWPIALAPTPGGPDAEGCWSGCAVDHDGAPTLIYTGVDPQVVCLATSDDDLLTWQKHPLNPVIQGPPDAIRERAGGDFRDPFVWRAGDRWYMVIGARIIDQGGTILLYQSEDLLHWRYVHPLLMGDAQRTEPFWTGTMWECPNWIDFGAEQALLVSMQTPPAELLYVGYYLGAFNEADLTFTPTSEHLLDDGRCFYAPQVLRDDRDRVLMWGWLIEGRTSAAQLEAGWSGVMSLPRVISPGPNGWLRMRPAPELRALRRAHYHLADVDLPAPRETFQSLGGASGYRGDSGYQGDSLEIIAELALGSATEVGIKVRCSPDEAECTRIIYDRAREELRLDLEQASADPATTRAVYRAPFVPIAEDAGPIRCHIFIDHSVIEVFVNERICLTGRIYPTRADSQGVAAYARGGDARLVSLDAWTLTNIWHR